MQGRCMEENSFSIYYVYKGLLVWSDVWYRKMLRFSYLSLTVPHKEPLN